MRCRGCSVENEAGAKFCTECGTKMSLQNNMVVLCDGLDDEGNACTAELFQDYKFCKECGKRVDPKLFERQMEVCKGVREDGQVCGAALTGNSPFCPECGTRQPTERKSDVVAVYPPVIKEQADPVASGGIVRVNPVQVTDAGIQRPSDSAGLGERFVEKTNENTVTTDKQSAAVQKAVNIKTVDNSVSPHCPDSPLGIEQHGEGGMVHQKLDLSLKSLTGQGDSALVPPKESVGADCQVLASQDDLKDSSENVFPADQETGNTDNVSSRDQPIGNTDNVSSRDQPTGNTENVSSRGQATGNTENVSTADQATGKTENVSSRDQVTDNTENQTSLKTPETTAAPETGENGEFSDQLQKKLLIIDSDPEGESGDTEEMEVEETNVNQNNCGDSGTSNVTGVIKQGQPHPQAAGNHEDSPPNKEVSDIDGIHSSDDAVTEQRLDNASKMGASVVSQPTTAGDDNRKEKKVGEEPQTDDADNKDAELRPGADTDSTRDREDNKGESSGFGEKMDGLEEKGDENKEDSDGDKPEDDEADSMTEDSESDSDTNSTVSSLPDGGNVTSTSGAQPGAAPGKKRRHGESTAKKNREKKKAKRSIKPKQDTLNHEEKDDKKKRQDKGKKLDEKGAPSVSTTVSNTADNKTHSSSSGSHPQSSANDMTKKEEDQNPVENSAEQAKDGLVFGGGVTKRPQTTTGCYETSGLFDSVADNSKTKTATAEEEGGGANRTSNAADGQTTGNRNADKNKKPANQQKQKQQQQQSKGNTGTTNRQKPKESVPVQFHVFIGKDFKFKPDKREFHISFGHEYLGNWKISTKLEEVRKLENGLIEMKVEIDYPKDLLGRDIPYKYSVVHVEGKKKGKTSWEGYYSSMTFSTNRQIKVMQPCKKSEIWHQFDGVVHPEEGAWAKLTGLFMKDKEVAMQDAMFCVQHYLPDWFHPFSSTSRKPETSVMDSLAMLKAVFYGLDRSYRLDRKCLQLDKFRAEIGCSMLSKVVQSIQTAVKEGQDKKTRERCFISALAVLLAMMENNIPYGCLESEEKRTLLGHLLIHPDPENKTFTEKEMIDEHFSDKRALEESLEAFCRHLTSTTKDLTWAYLMPLVHFLSGSCKPFQAPLNSAYHSNDDPAWWGITKKLGDTIKRFKDRPVEPKAKPFSEVIVSLAPLFEMDYLLPRTIVASLSIEELKGAIETRHLPVEAIAAALMFYMKIAYFSYSMHYVYSSVDDYKVYQIDQSLLALIEHMKKIEFENLRSKEDLIPLLLSYKITGELANYARLSNLWKQVSYTSQIHVHAVAMYDLALSQLYQEQPHTRSGTEHLKFLEEMNGKLTNWIASQMMYCRDLEFKFVLWNAALVGDHIKPATIQQQWNAKCLDAFRIYLKKEYATRYYKQKLVETYCKEVNKLHPDMQDCLTQASFEAIKDGYSMDYSKLSDEEKTRFAELLSHLFGNNWSTNVIEGVGEESYKILRHILTWQPFVHFLRMFYQEMDGKKLLTETCQVQIVLAVSVLDSTAEDLRTGRMTVGLFKLINEAENKFPELVNLVGTEGAKEEVKIKKMMKLREKELKAHEEEGRKVTTLTSLCQHLGGIGNQLTRDLDAAVELLRNRDDLRFEQMCFVVEVDAVENVNQYKPKVIAFPMSDKVKAILDSLHHCYDSSVFIKIWQQLCRDNGQDCQTLDDLVDRIWTPVKQTWDDVSRRITSGEIHFKEMEKCIGDTYKTDYKAMIDEMQVMEVPEKVANGRVVQLKQHRQLSSCVKGAKIIQRFAKMYGLTGNFKPIENLASQEGDSEMRSFDDKLMKACDFLKDLTEVRSNCLNTFLKCRELVTWLKESMKQGLKELKVFVDLAYISAGDTPMEIDRVQVLHSAVTGYAPLIFELDEGAGYKELLKTCGNVWKELDANPNLPRQLHDTAHLMEWLKNVQKAHGSVEVTSLEQASAINARGVYLVGFHIDGHGDRQAETNDLASALILTVPADKGEKTAPRRYNFHQLQDLQSRLMLVAGKAEKGKDDVDRFTTIFDSVLRLAKAYMNLCSSGCVLFKHWQAKFLCDRNRKVCSFIDFGQGVEQLKGKTSDLTKIIPMIASFMEGCHKNWLEYIHKKRIDHLHLNFFTIDQLVFLQKELVKIGTREEPSHRLYPLLSVLKENCLPEDLVLAMQNAKQDFSGEDSETVEDTETDVNMTEDETYQFEVEQFINDIVDSGYSAHVARKALEVFKPSEVDEAVSWCFDYENNMDENPGSTQEEVTLPETETTAPFVTPYSSWTTTGGTILSSIMEGLIGAGSDTKAEELIRNLNRLWDTFLQSVSSCHLTDYLSVEHLGRILRKLAEQMTRPVERPFQPIFRDGEPNLIVCPSADVLNTVLTIYMYPLDGDQLLPGPDEVLLCTNTTTHDQLDIFWRRALFDSQGKIHCLVNADLLDFDVSDRGEATLERYRQELQYNKTEPEYKLVVVCSSDNENRSRIVAALDRYRRPPLPIDCPNLKKFLLKKLRIMEPINGKKSAASLDFEKSSVRLVKSWRAGVGKTLYKRRRETELLELKRATHQDTETISVPLQEKSLKVSGVARKFLQHTEPPGKAIARIFHIDVAHEVEEGVDYVLFNLLILGSIMDKSGHVWQKSRRDLYLIEAMPLMVKSNDGQGECYLHHIFEVLPSITCRSPQESLHIYRDEKKPQDLREEDQLFDRQEFGSESFQRPYQYLERLDRNLDLVGVDPQTVIGREPDCLEVLLRHCGVPDPSWSELHHFVWFLNTQLRDFEGSSFTGLAAAEYLPGFAKFTLRFLIQMSRDFSTRSLVMSEESTAVQMIVEEDENDEQDIAQFQMRRTWESSPHPYLFFNPDHHSITFLGFNINKQTGNLQDQQTGQVLEHNIMQKDLYDALVQNSVPIRENFDDLPRSDKITKLCSVLGVEFPYDPDDTYELTTDNVKKILAIYMRFRCNIPVIIMGETGCGKTRLVKFMCSLQVPAGVEVNNMILMKVHGGTTNADIIKKVHHAETVAADNTTNYPHMYTVLFFDEANTTESIGLIKEIMCDRSIDGVPLKLSQNLKMVAACNPYRKHSDELIKKLEQAGLGYHVDADKTTDKLGRVPMRRLVYRVQPLPQSLLPLVWDFGQLNTHVEDLYIRQMVRRYIRDEKLPDIAGLVEAVSAILVASQEYMRRQQDECSFVSLRDVDRVLTVMSWFMDDSLGFRDGYDSGNSEYEEEEEEDEEEEEEEAEQNAPINDETHSLILALGVCYHACLKTRKEYREHVARSFRAPCAVPGGAEQIDNIIVKCQDALLENVELEKNIAKNTALKENVFMMVVCTELRIPLFLVGKPGSSKSLAKTIVADAMQGNAAHSDMFKNLKQVQMVSFQCSPLSTPDGIVGTFKQCAQFQKDKSLDRFVSVVVLDEVGLAEDSPRMPLKTLHPLLEDGCQGDEEPEEYKKVAFIGISNWALDPAKMNRGILVQREVPDIEELKASAEGICTEENEKLSISPLVQPLAESYLELFKEASQSLREFFGLRDFYSLIKMVYMFAEKSKKKPTWHELVHSIHRNFGGLERVNPIEVFKKHLTTLVNIDQEPLENDPDCSPAGLIKACLFNTNQSDSESRYLLLLTENYGALPILEQQILAEDKLKAVTVFGSSFPSDQEYTQVCRNINKIKVCMETGNTVVLLNLENLYESLYDALNQYYVYFGGARYVDLGLGSHRVKCRVHREFRLIVVAEKQVVYKKFPIPLINRLEKHFLTINTMLSDVQKALAKELEQWAEHFVSERVHRVLVAARNAKTNEQKIGDVFMGYHDDTCPAIILHVCESFEHDSGDEVVLAESKKILLWCAVPDAVIRLQKSRLLPQEQEQLHAEYFQQQHHNNLCEYLHFSLQERKTFELLAQVTTHSKLLTAIDKKQLSLATEVSVDGIMIETLQSFDTELQFKTKIRGHFETQLETTKPQLLLVQCDSGDVNANLVACARYCVLEIHSDMTLRDRNIPFHVVFIVQLPRIAGGCFTGFQCGRWHSAHIDDLRATEEDMPNIQDMQFKSIADLISSGVTSDDHKMDHTTGSDETTSEIYRREESAMEVEEGREIPPSISQHSSEEPIHLNDVELHLQDPAGGQVTASYKGQHNLNVGGLILSCVQSSLAMVKDSKESSERTTKRVDILLSLLNVHKKTERDMEERGSALFCAGLSHLLASLLKEKENTHGNKMLATQWMPNEAAINTAITKAGTFRRSCTRVIESKISPMLAGAIAFLDTNGNLDILQEGTDNGWRTQIWLAFLHSPSALQLHYSDLQSPSREKELNEVIVKETGVEGHSFSSGMPFSWLIFEQIEKLKVEYRNTNIEEEKEEEEKEEKKVDAEEVLLNLLLNIPQGKILCRVDTEQNREEILNCYLHDFIHLVYNPRSDEEHKLVSQSVWYLTHSILEQRHWTSLLHGLLAIHHAHDELRARLGYFSDMNRVWPQCSQVILQIKENNPDHFMFKEEEFTFSVLALLIENLEPKTQKQLDDAKGRLEWLNRVYRCRPVVEKVMQLQVEDSTVFGTRGQRSIHNARCGWTKVVIMKLFLEHVCSAGVKLQHQEKITVKNCMTFWKMLGKEANMKEITTLEVVEKFLKMCNKVAQKEYLGKLDACPFCETPIQGLPIVLPCKHSLCDLCFEELKATTCRDCPTCKKNFPRDYNPNTNAHERVEVQRFVDYQKRCNSFFMDAVSQLCFAHNEPPSDIVVEKLLSYITLKQNNSQTIKTKDLTIFSSGLDPNPVFRSFLLQLLLRTSEEKVEENLNKYFDTARDILQQGNPDVQEDFIQLCLLVIQCLEDKLCKEAVKDNEIQIAIVYLRQARYGLHGESIEKLHSLAKSRIGLAITAKYINSIVEQSQTTVCAEVRRLIEEAEKLCDDEFCKWPRIYMVKYLCRYYGQNSYHALCTTKIPYLKWIRLRNIQQKVECADRYIVCGDQYRQIREAVTQVTIGEDFKLLDDLIGELHGRGQFKEVHLRLALHKEVTCSHLYPATERKINPENMDRVRENMLNSGFTKNTTVLQALLDNQIGGQCDLLRVSPGLDLRNQGLQCLLVHCFAVFVDMDADQTLLSPIQAMITRPQELQISFLPSMPQDETAEVREALLAYRNTTGGAGENPVFYRCPNGHPYVIGNCGRPATVGRCIKCGQEIGGTGYQLKPGNQLDDNTDHTETGHVIGRAANSGDGPLVVRSLTTSTSACVRLITHLSMFLGALANQQAVNLLIKPALDANQVYHFLWDHIVHDIGEIQQVIGISFDDALLLMHLILHSMVSRAAVPLGDREIHRWTSQTGRRKWEEKFVATYLKPILQNTERDIAEANKQLLGDERLGADPLLRLLYEIDTHVHRVDLENLQDLPSVWRYRNQISIAHLQNAFAAKMNDVTQKKKYAILQLFLKEEHILRAMLYVPSVLKLQRKLIQKYQRKMDRAEASTITVSQLKRVDPELKDLIEDFADCWELVREYLKVYDCPTELGRMFVSKELCSKPVDNDTPVSMLLPTTRDAGLCSYAMLDFLFRKQNDVLDHFCQASRSVARKRREEMSKVNVDELTPAHLICFHRDQDLLSMVFANCQYSFEVGSGTKIQYDFDGLERQIMDRFLYSKSRIDIQGFLKIQLMEYRAEYTNAVVFKKLEEKIPQESVGNAVKRQVCDDNKNLPDLCRSIDNLDITISFLKSIGGNPEENLDHFMRETLKMNTPLHSQKARQYCQFKHARALWVLMSLMKARKMAEHQQGRQAVFDHLHDEYREVIAEELEEMLEVYLQGLTVERLDNLLEVMYECIVLVISIPQNPDDEDYSDNKNMSLRDMVMVHAENMEPSVLDTQILSDFPEDVKCKHCSSAWVLVFDVLYQKRTGQRL